MLIRKRTLNAGWYPKNPEEVKKTLDGWTKESSRGDALAAVVPHAGWYFSGKLAFQTLGSLRRDFDVVAVLGGHLSQDSPLLIAGEDGFEVPGGVLKNDLALVKEVRKVFKAEEDWDADNGVEVQLPIIHYFWPESKVVSLRVPPTAAASALGEFLYRWSQSTGAQLGVVGSTDLTHYGPHYGFTPQGMGPSSVVWAEETNDAEIIRLLLSMQEEPAAEHAKTHRSACSIGAAVAAMAFAREAGVKEGRLKGYQNSYHTQPGSSFVGYAGITYS